MAINQFKEVEFNKRLSRLEQQSKTSHQLLQFFSEKFCWYWITEKKKQFAIICRQSLDVREKKITADLVVLDTEISSGSDIRIGKEIWIYNPTKEDDANPKKGKYEPILDPDEIVKIVAENKEVADASTALTDS